MTVQNFSYLLGSIFYSLITSPDPNCSVGERDGLKCVETLKNVSHEDALQRCSDNNMKLWSGQSDQVKYLISHFYLLIEPTMYQPF